MDPEHEFGSLAMAIDTMDGVEVATRNDAENADFDSEDEEEEDCSSCTDDDSEDEVGPMGNRIAFPPPAPADP